jgi:hypothetical protein
MPKLKMSWFEMFCLAVVAAALTAAFWFSHRAHWQAVERGAAALPPAKSQPPSAR